MSNITIFASPFDVLVDRVMDWACIYHKRSVRRWNADQPLPFSLAINNRQNTVELGDGTSTSPPRIWLKKYNHDFQPTVKEAGIRAHVSTEWIEAKKAVLDMMGDRIFLGPIPQGGHVHLNKGYQLRKATEAGMNVPDTLITTSKAALLEFFESHDGAIIVKAASEGVIVEKDDGKYASFTSALSLSDIQAMEPSFHPVLVQVKMDKQADVRLFFCHDHIRAAALFTQMRRRSVIDSRRYDPQRLYRIVPLEIPDLLKRQIRAFMKSMHTTYGVLDLVLTRNDEFVFLELNLNGKFFSISERCRLKIDKLIAHVLCT